MENKYQASYNRVFEKSFRGGLYVRGKQIPYTEKEERKDWSVLQELIDNYSKLEAERNYLVMDNASLIDRNNQLEKSLDMLIDCHIKNVDVEICKKDKCPYFNECHLEVGFGCKVNEKWGIKEWKEWIIKQCSEENQKK